MKNATQTAMEVRKLNMSFGEKRVLNDVSLQIKTGAMYGLIGLNGVGKTTMIKIILGLLSQDSGKSFINGKPSNDVQTRKTFSYLPEKFQPSVFLKGKEYISLTLSYYGKSATIEQMEDGARKLELDPAALHLKISNYSKGMTQKLGLLAALLTETPLLILDEPMSGLDPSARINLKDVLSEYVSRGNTIFFSSHILADIDEICDEIGIIHGSKVIYTGTPKAFKAKHKGKTLERAFLASIGA